MSNHGSRNNDCYRERTQQIVPAMVSGRTTCTGCGQHQSDGQFPLNSTICITCKPQGLGFRRGQLDHGLKAQFQQSEITMEIEEKALRMIGGEPMIRSMLLMDRVNADFADLEPVLEKLLAEGKIVAHQVTAPNGRPATGYTLSDQARSDAREAAPGVPMDSGSKIESAIRYIRANDGATSAQLHKLLGLAADALVSQELAPALADGRLVKDGKDWSLGVAPAAPVVAEPAVKLMRDVFKIDTPPAPRAAPTIVALATQIVGALADPGPAPTVERLAEIEHALATPPAPAEDEPDSSIIAPPAIKHTIIPPLPFRCGIWSDGVLELQRDGQVVAELTRDEAAKVAEFVASMVA